MARADHIRGVIAPVLTPFDASGRPDDARFAEHARALLDGGCTALAPFGTTSEANSMGLWERMALLEALIDEGVSPSRLLPGTGTCARPDTVRLTRDALELGCAGVLMLPPFYYKGVSVEGLYAYFSEVIERVGDDRLRVYLYHIPQVAGVGISLELITRLVAAYPDQIAGLKDSSGEWDNTRAAIERFPGLRVFSGSEATLLANLRAGGAGCISATANVNARSLRSLLDGWQAEGAEARQQAVAAVRQDIQSRPLIPLLKAMLAEHYGDETWRAVRPPLEAMDGAEARRFIARLEADHGFTAFS